MATQARLVGAHEPAQPLLEGKHLHASTDTLLDLTSVYWASTPGERLRVERGLLAAAADRRSQLAALIEDNPAAVIAEAIPASIRAQMPGSLGAYLEQDAEIEGSLQIIHEHVGDAARYRYLVDTAQGRYALHFAGTAPTHLLTGATVRVAGLQIGNLLAIDGGNKAAVRQVAPAPAPTTVGAQRTLAILVNFQDDPTQPYTIAQARDALFGTASSYFLEGSFNQTWLEGDVAGWFTIAASAATCDPSAIANGANAAATSAGYALSTYGHYVYIFRNACGGRGFSTLGGYPSQSWINNTLELNVIAHELGHGMGLWHSHALDCDSVALGPTCSSWEYGNEFDSMGNTYAGHYNAFQKEQLGWLNYGATPPITTVSTSGTYTLETYELAGTGPKALKILQSADLTTGARTWFYVEARQAAGFDAFLAGNANVLDGVLIHTGSEASGDSSYLLDMTPASAFTVSQEWWDPALVTGRSFYDPVSGVSITTNWVTATAASVTVNLGATNPSPPSSSSPPNVSVTTDRSSYARNQTVAVTANVMSAGTPVTNASVTFNITKSTGGVISGTAKTDGNGVATYSMRLRKQDPVGTYQAGATATDRALTGSGSTSFLVQ